MKKKIIPSKKMQGNNIFSQLKNIYHTQVSKRIKKDNNRKQL